MPIEKVGVHIFFAHLDMVLDLDLVVDLSDAGISKRTLLRGEELVQDHVRVEVQVQVFSCFVLGQAWAEGSIDGEGAISYSCRGADL